MAGRIFRAGRQSTMWRRAPLTLALFVTLLCAGVSASAQDAQRRAALYVSAGDSMLRLGDQRAAARAYEDALLARRGTVDALRGLGRIAFEEEDWGGLRKRFNDVLDQLPGDPEAHYYAGIADREIGRTRPPLINDLVEWRRAENHFETVLAVDSAYKDVLYQYALLKVYSGGRSNWEEALALVNRRLQMRDVPVSAEVGAYQLYRRFIERWDDDRTAEWLRALPVAYAVASAAAIDHERGRSDSAERSLQALALDDSERAAIAGALELVRLYAATDRDDLAEGAFHRATASIISPAGAAVVFEDIKYVATDAELREFRTTSQHERLRSFFDRFWAKRNPLPAADYNPRLREHYRRLLYADQYFVYYGYRGWVNSPDKLGYLDFPDVYELNERYNDKGLVYIRHGQPNDRIVTMGASADPNESWLYYEGQDRERLEFHFVLESNTSGGNNWRLTAILTNPQMLLDRAEWGSRYYQMYAAQTDSRRRLDAGMLEIEMGERSRAFVKEGLTTDRHTWEILPEPLPFWYHLVTSRADSGRTLVDVLYLTPMRELAVASEPDQEVTLETGVAIHDRSWRPVARRAKQETYKPTSTSGDIVLGSFTFEVEPDSYHVAIHAQVRGANRIAGWKFDEAIPDYGTPGGKMSGIIPAYEVRPARREESNFVRNGLRVLPNPSRRYYTERPLFFYFEVYDLTLGPDDRTDFRLRYTLEPLERKRRGLLGLFGRSPRPVLSLEFDREGDSMTSVEYGQLDVSGVEPGEYTLSVTVTDRISGSDFGARIPIVLVPPPS